MKKVVQILYSGLGGHGSVFFSLIEADQNKKAQHFAIFYGIEALREEYIAKCKEWNIDHRYYFKKPGWDLATQREMLVFLEEIQPDVILLHSPINLYLCRKYKQTNPNCQLIMVEHTPHQIKRKKDWLLSAYAFSICDQIVYLTPEYKEVTKNKLGFFYKENKTSIIPNGIDIAQFYQPQAYQSDKKDLLIGMQARMSNSKDHATLLRAFALLKEDPIYQQTRLRFAGDGETRASLETLTDELGIRAQVDFTGMLNEQDLIVFVNQLDIYVHATLGETMSTSIMQAQAAGLPIIASDISGVNNLIEQDKTGILVPPSKAEALSQAILALLKDEPKRKTLAQAARQYALNELSNEIMWNRYFALMT